MTQYLLDTHVVLWALTAPDRLSEKARTIVSVAANEIAVSAATAWEIALKHRIGKLPHAEPLLSAYSQHLTRLGAQTIAISDEHALLAGGLDWTHRDPFDRMLAAQSILTSRILVTSEVAFATLPGLRHLW